MRIDADQHGVVSASYDLVHEAQALRSASRALRASAREARDVRAAVARGSVRPLRGGSDGGVDFDERRRRIVAKVHASGLPLEIPEVHLGRANGETCTACGSSIAPGHSFVRGTIDATTLLFHIACFSIWDGCRQSRLRESA